MQFSELIHLEPHGADVLVGTGPRYPWGGLYGGQIVAQALQAAASTVEGGFAPHSLRAYFIRAGDHTEPVRYEVDRIRNGRSFCTRRVVARQATGAILNLEASFHVGDDAPAVQTIEMGADVPGPDGLESDSWAPAFERRFVPDPADSVGTTRGWFRIPERLDDEPLLHAAALAYQSDDLPTDAVVRGMGIDRSEFEAGWFCVSLDHTIWFHRPIRADDWHLQVFTCHGATAGRGLAIGHVFTPAGVHAATVAQEVLVRRRRN